MHVYDVRMLARKVMARLAAALFLIVVALPTIPTHAHDLEFSFTIIVLRADGTYQVDMTCDLDALALGVAQEVDSAQVLRRLRELRPAELTERVNDLRELLSERVTLRFDDSPAHPELSFPEYGTPRAAEAEIPTLLGLTARFVGPLPVEAADLTFQVARSFPPVYLSIIDERSDRSHEQILLRGGVSDPFPIRADVPVPPQTGWAVLARYLALGLQHIVPEGPDHMLFVLGLFLLSARIRPLLFQVTAFTVAHTLTLALSSYGVFGLPPSLVEPLIALSISYVAIENILTRELTPWRPLVVFMFGLLHGMGFAGVLGELGLPASDFLTALLGFNAGVECGQLLVLVGAFLTIGRFRHQVWYRGRMSVPLSLVIAAVGLYWSAQRIFFS